jgi:hypothetical protein
MNKELKDKLLSTLEALPEGFTCCNLSWSADGVNYSLGISVYGGSLTITGNAHKPDPPNPSATEAVALPQAA